MELKKQIVELACVYSLKAYDRFGGDNVVYINNDITSATAYVIKGDIQIVAFRGTEEVHDWLFNLTAIPYRYNKRWCHGGFVLSHKSIWKRVRRQLDPNRLTIVCGHSLGGALAELSAHCMRDFTDLHLVAFGKPNVFLKSKGPNMGHLKTQMSFIHGSDVVSRLPRYLYGPDKNQKMIYFDCLDRTHINPDRDFLEADWSFRRAISDHCMEEYVDLVRTRYLTILPDIDETEGGEGSESIQMVL